MDGPVLKTVVDRLSRPAGSVVEHWDGFSEGGGVLVPVLMKAVTPQGEMEMETNTLTRYPGSSKAVMTMPMGTVTRVVTPEAAFVVTPMGMQDIPSSQRESIANELKTELLAVLKNIGNPKYVFSAGATEKIGDVDARLLEIGADGATVKWFVDPAAGKVLRTVSRPGGPMPGDSVTDYTEWKAFDGLNLPVAANGHPQRREGGPPRGRRTLGTCSSQRCPPSSQTPCRVACGARQPVYCS